MRAGWGSSSSALMSPVDIVSWCRMLRSGAGETQLRNVCIFLDLSSHVSVYFLQEEVEKDPRKPKTCGK